MDFSIEDNCYVNNKFIGTTVAKKITVNILNPNNEINLENKEISVQTGMIIDSIEESVPFGNFIIEKPDSEEVKEKTSFTGYDYMVKFNIPYKKRVTFPISAGDLFEDVCGQAGVEVGNTDFVNSNYMILGNPFTNNEDCRTVLSNLAQLAGGFAKIGRDNKAYIKSLKNISNLLKVKDVNAMTVKELNLTIVKMLSGGRDNADETLDGNNYLDDFAKNDKWGEVNSVILRISGTEGENTTIQDETSIQENGLTELVIEDNYFLIDETEREKAITPLWNALKGIEYLPFKTTYYGYPYLDSGDIIYIQDTKDIGYISYVFNHTFKYNGAYSGTIDTPAMTKTQTAYKNTINTKTKFLQVERKIDKINGEISDVIKSVDENTEKLSSHEQTLDSITDTLSSVETTVETVDNKVDTAQSTADTANQNAQNAQQIANNAVSQITTTTQKVTEIEQTVDGITQSVSNVEEKVETVETKADNAQKSADTANTNATNAQNTANSINDNLTTNYYTKTETNSEINQKADEISSTVSKTYSTKTETTQAKQDAINSANASTDEKLEDYSTTEEMNSAITQKADEINSTVSKKVGKNEIISTINQSAESVKINADKIELTANDILNLLAGNTINIQSRNIKIASDNFNVDSKGNITANSATLKNVTITDGTIKLKSDDYALGVFRLQGTDKAFEAGASGLAIHSSSGSSNITDEGISYSNYLNGTSMNINSSGIKTHHITINDGGNKNVTIEGNGYLGCDQLYVDAGGINCVGNIQAHNHIYCNNGVEPFSLAEKKRDIEKYNNKALEEVLNTDIYYYNYKEDSEDIKRRVGAIIGTDYKCSKEIIGTEGKGIDLYSMISVAYKAIQEQQEIIEKQNKTIENLTAKVEKLEKTIEELTARVEKLEKAGEK